MDQTRRIKFNIYLDKEKLSKKKRKNNSYRANYSSASEYVKRQVENTKGGICYNRIIKFPTGCNYLYGFVKHNLYKNNLQSKRKEKMRYVSNAKKRSTRECAYFKIAFYSISRLLF